MHRYIAIYYSSVGEVDNPKSGDPWFELRNILSEILLVLLDKALYLKGCTGY